MAIWRAHKELKAGKITAVELTQRALKKAKSSQLNTFISLTEQLALRQAEQADNEMKKQGPRSWLHGIPVSLKDLFITKGIRTTAGSKMLYNYIPPYEGFVARRLQEQGGILMGKVGCDEFGMGSTNEYSYFGPVKNPRNPKKVAGGSSGGSAASVAEESSLLSVGTDTGGSVRLPANFCGLVGFKPTYGRISRHGQIAYASSLDQASFFGQEVLDTACALEVFSGHDPQDATSAPLEPLRCVEEVAACDSHFWKGKVVGILPDLMEKCGREVKGTLDEAIALVKKQGAHVVDLSLGHLKYGVSAYYIIATSEASANLARYDGIHYGFRKRQQENLEATFLGSRSEGLGAEVQRRILLGTFSLSSGYYEAYYRKACQVRQLITDDFQHGLGQCDVILSPVSATTAFDLGDQVKDPFQMYLTDLFTIPVNLAGLPAVALPFGQGTDGMPTGIQFIGRPFEEKLVCQAARAFELARGKQ